MNEKIYEAADEYADSLEEAYSLTIEEWRSSREGFKAGYKYALNKSEAVQVLLNALEEISNRQRDPYSMASDALEQFKELK